MELRYHPLTAFSLVFIAGLLLLMLVLVVLSIAAPEMSSTLSGSGFLIYLPFLLTFFAAQQAYKGNGPPFIHLLREDLNALRDDFDRRHLFWAIAFALQATLVMTVFAGLLWLAGEGSHPFQGWFMLAVCLVINFACCFQALKHSMAPPETFRPNSDTIEANPAALTAWAVRRMQKNMGTDVSDRPNR